MRRMTAEFFRRRPVFLAVALFALLACLMTYPQVVRIRDSIPAAEVGRPFEGPFLNAWILAWGACAGSCGRCICSTRTRSGRGPTCR